MGYINRIYAGRIDSRTYSLGLLLCIAVTLVSGLLLTLLTVTRNITLTTIGFVMFACSAITIIVHAFSLHVRRLHDIGWSGLWSFVSLISPFNLIMLLALMVTDGQMTANKYGEVPEKRKFFESFLNRSLED